MSQRRGKGKPNKPIRGRFNYFRTRDGIYAYTDRQGFHAFLTHNILSGDYWISLLSLVSTFLHCRAEIPDSRIQSDVHLSESLSLAGSDVSFDQLQQPLALLNALPFLNDSSETHSGSFEKQKASIASNKKMEVVVGYARFVLPIIDRAKSVGESHFRSLLPPF